MQFADSCVEVARIYNQQLNVVNDFRKYLDRRRAEFNHEAKRKGKDGGDEDDLSADEKTRLADIQEAHD